mgnify:CR=1 FL=1
MRKNKTYHRKKTVLLWVLCMGMMVGLAGRLVYLCVFRSVYYSEKADDLHERERGIKAARGRILDANGEVLAANRTVCTISVIHSQIEEPEAVIAMLVKELGISEETARKRVEKRSSNERVKTNVDKKTGDTIRSYGYAGVKVDEDFKRYYPKGKLASRVIGFTGGDNQGIIGLEVEYEEILKGINGKILTTTDARGIEQNGIGESRQEPVAGRDLKVSLDVNIQAYCQQAAEKAMAEKQADSVSILLMNPQNGEIYACVNVPEFDLNDPFTLQQDTTGLSEKEIQDLLNQMWRNACINDTYEPGSTFKIVTALEYMKEHSDYQNYSYNCEGSITYEDITIRCFDSTVHGLEDLRSSFANSCNSSFANIGLMLDRNSYRATAEELLFNKKLPSVLDYSKSSFVVDENTSDGEMMMTAMGQGNTLVSPYHMALITQAIANGGTLMEPYLVDKVTNYKGTEIRKNVPKSYKKLMTSEEASQLKDYMRAVVDEGTATMLSGQSYSVAGKTGTAEYSMTDGEKTHSWFVGFTNVDNPELVISVIIEGYDGNAGAKAVPIAKQVLDSYYYQ